MKSTFPFHKIGKTEENYNITLKAELNIHKLAFR